MGDTVQTPLSRNRLPELNNLPEGITLGSRGSGVGKPILKLKRPVCAPYAIDIPESDAHWYSKVYVEYACVLFPPSSMSMTMTTVCPCSREGYLWGRLREPDQALINDQVRERMEDLLEVERRRNVA